MTHCSFSPAAWAIACMAIAGADTTTRTGDPWWDDVAEAADQAEQLRQHAWETATNVLRRELSLVRQTCPSLERQQPGGAVAGKRMVGIRGQGSSYEHYYRAQALF